ncbi:alpha-hydroxy acid oxidase [Chloroflexota bacterium]
MENKQLTISEIYAKGKENLEKKGIKREIPPDSNLRASMQANRRYLDSLFFETKYFDPVDVDTSLTIFGVKLKTPVFCSAISRLQQWTTADMVDITRGVGKAGSLIMYGIGGSDELQAAIDTGTPIVKIVKPYRRTELVYEKVRDAESRGCVAVGMDIDHSYGRLAGDRVENTETFGPQSSSGLKQLISQTKLPFIIKGILSVQDAEKATQLGASAIVVSNKGRGALDFAIPNMIALPKIVDSVGYKLPVLIDTGFKTGNDTFKALAFGAKAVGFVSSMLLAQAAGGADYVELLINQLTAELHRTMSATGCPNLSAINRSIITHLPLANQ